MVTLLTGELVVFCLISFRRKYTRLLNNSSSLLFSSVTIRINVRPPPQRAGASNSPAARARSSPARTPRSGGRRSNGSGSRGGSGGGSAGQGRGDDDDVIVID